MELTTSKKIYYEVGHSMFRKLIMVSLLFFLMGCATITPLQLPKYNPPDFSSLKRPDIPLPEEGKDYTINTENGTVTYTLSGQNLLTAKILSEKVAWAQIEMLIQMIEVQGEIIKQKDQLLITVDLQRQMAERDRSYESIKSIISQIIAVIVMGLTIAK